MLHRGSGCICLLVYLKPFREDNYSHLDYNNQVSKISHIRLTQSLTQFFFFTILWMISDTEVLCLKAAAYKIYILLLTAWISFQA